MTDLPLTSGVETVNKWWLFIYQGDKTYTENVQIGDYVYVKDSSGNIVAEGTVYKKIKKGDKYSLWIRRKELDFLKGKNVYLMSSVVEYDVDKKLSEAIDEAMIKIPATENLALEIGQPVEVWISNGNLGGKKIFEGYLRQRDEIEGYGNLKIRSWGDILGRTYVDKVYYNKDVAEIVQDLITNYTNLNVITETTSLILEKFVAKDYLLNILKKLATMSDFQFRIDGNTLYFEKKGKDLLTGEINRGNAIFGKWNYITDRMINDLHLVGASQTFKQLDNFTGDGTTKTFTLTFRPKGSFEVYINDEKQSKETYEVDEESRQITFENAPPNGAIIKVYYDYEVPIYIHSRNEESIRKYGIFSKKERVLWIKDYTMATDFARVVLDNYSEPEKVNTIKMSIRDILNLGIEEGKKIRVVDEVNGINEIMLIKQVRLHDAIGEITVGSITFDILEWGEKIQERMRQLEMEQKAEEYETRYLYFKEKVKAVITPTVRIKKRELTKAFIVGRTQIGAENIGAEWNDWTTILEVKG